MIAYVLTKQGTGLYSEPVNLYYDFKTQTFKVFNHEIGTQLTFCQNTVEQAKDTHGGEIQKFDVTQMWEEEKKHEDVEN